jgi:hypothetical protein
VAAHDVECALRMLSKKQHGCAGESLFQHVHPSAEAPAAILAFVYSKVFDSSRYCPFLALISNSK